MIHEGPLQSVELVAGGEPFDGAYLLAVGLHCEHQAGADRRAVDQHGAGAADAVLAADMGAGLAAILANGIHQRAPRLDPDGVAFAVDRQGDFGSFAHAGIFPAWRSAARMRCGVAGISLMLTPNGVNASLIALRTAAGAPMAPPSPSPLDLVRVASLSVSR